MSKQFACIAHQQDTIYRRHVVHTLKFTCDRGVSHELVRHRLASFAQESTRYCNYSQDKFNNEIAVIRPYYLDEGCEGYAAWLYSCKVAEGEYFRLLEFGMSPQEARAVLPTSLKTEIAVTATEIEWQHILDLRYHGYTGKPHPQMLEVMKPAAQILMKKSNGRLV